jgi:hypothetical protein
MSLLNVRLNSEDARKAKALRSAGVPISAVVRAAIRAEYEKRLPGAASGMKPSDIVAETLAGIPDPPDMPPKRADPADRRAVRRAIAARLKRRR